jgi:hypothetical protein
MPMVGRSPSDERVFGAVFLKNRDQPRVFCDRELLWPYFKAYKAQKAVHDQEARMQLMVALGQEAPIWA